jgi:hypothetical protein
VRTSRGLAVTVVGELVLGLPVELTVEFPVLGFPVVKVPVEVFPVVEFPVVVFPGSVVTVVGSLA